jgi:glycosyltransferase involved in cell wall biosynthesis
VKVLFTTPILEYPAAGGPQLRIENSIKVLSRVSELDIIHRASYLTNETVRTDEYFSKYAKNYLTLYDYNQSGFTRLVQRILRRFFVQKKIKHFQEIISHIKINKIEVVWFGYGNISYPLIAAIKAEIPTIKIVCDTDSVWSRFILRELPFAIDSRKRKIELAGKQKEEEEKAWVGLCEVTTAVSEIDAEYYRSIAIDPGRIHLFSNVVDIDNYKYIPDAPDNFIKPCIFLAGSYGPNSAMNMASKWILDEVLPILHKNFPDLHFYLVGRNSDREFANRAGPNITVTGKLESVLPYLCHANIALVPLKFESGTRFKILEAGACRIPLVSTTLGAEGIPIVDGRHILIADEPDKFACAITKILTDQSFGNFLAENCFQLVNTNYSLTSLASEAESILKFLEHG